MVIKSPSVYIFSNRKMTASRMRYPTFLNSLHARLIAWLVIPMLFLSVALLYSSYLDTKKTSEVVFDRLLVALALSISEHALATEGDLLTDELLEMIRVTTNDSLYYKVNGPDGAFVIGYADLPEPEQGIDVIEQQVNFYDASYQDQEVRIVAVSTLVDNTNYQGWMTTFLAQTLNDREHFVEENLLDDLWRFLLVIVIVSLLFSIGVTIGLRPLTKLQASMDRRNPHDLSPLKQTPLPSEIKSVVHSLNDLLARLSSHISLTKQFVENAAHQLRTPVSALIPQTDLALRHAESEREKRAISKIRDSAKKIGRLTHQLLNLTYAESISLSDTDFEMIELDELVAKHVRKFADLHQQVRISQSLEPVKIRGADLLLGEVVENLLDNAMKYGQGDRVVDIRTHTKQGIAILQVSNHAGMIDEAKLDSLFNRFVRLGEKQEGSGLGLSIVKEIVEIHGGWTNIDYDVESGIISVYCSFPMQ